MKKTIYYITAAAVFLTILSFTLYHLKGYGIAFFVPILFTIWAGALPVFLITSILSAGMDLLFVALQRYNRSRVMKVIRKADSLTGKADICYNP